MPMKKIILIACLLLAMTACGRQQVPETVPTTQPTTAAVTEPEPTQEAEGDPYGEVLDAYATALEEGWGVEKYMEANMNYLPGLLGDPALVGYCLADLDMDESPELLIGGVEDSQIYAMYTMTPTGLELALRGSERSTYWLVSDGAFFNRGSNGASCTGYNFYTFYDGQLHFQDALIYDAGADPENPWFYAMDEDWDVSNDLPYGTGDAEAHIQMIEASLVELTYTPFSEYR